MSRKYQLTCRVEQHKIPDVLELVDSAHLEEIKESGYVKPDFSKKPVKTSKYRKASKYKEISRFKGLLTGPELILKILSDGKIHTAGEIEKEFKAQGFSRNSSSPRLSTMVKSGEVSMLGDGKYTRITKP